MPFGLIQLHYKRRRTIVDNDILTLEEVAQYLRVSYRTAFDWAQKGELPGGKLGTSWRFKKAEIVSWVDSRLGCSKINRKKCRNFLCQTLDPGRCKILDEENKDTAVTKVFDMLVAAPQVHAPHAVKAALLHREHLMSTGLGRGLAIPHVRHEGVHGIVLAIGVNRSPLSDYQTLDGSPVRVIAMILAGNDQHTAHVRLVAQLNTMIKNEDVRSDLLAAETPEELHSIVAAYRLNGETREKKIQCLSNALCA